eukprot:SAG11_NODE_10940_length_794_cov_2.755396_2_plen_59_part_00
MFVPGGRGGAGRTWAGESPEGTSTFPVVLAFYPEEEAAGVGFGGQHTLPGAAALSLLR